MNTQTIGAAVEHHSNTRSAATPHGVRSQKASQAKPQIDFQELKRQVGITPFTDRIKIDNDGYCACPFHNGDSPKSFHVHERQDGTYVGTCFSECSETWDAIDFVKKFDRCRTGEAIHKIQSGNRVSAAPPPLQKPTVVPMTPEKWATAGRAVADEDVAVLAASRPHSATPSAATLNEMGFRIGEKYGQRFLVAPYRLGNEFFTLKARNLAKKEFINENSVSQKGLFNIDAVTKGCDVFVVESELDAALLHESGYTAVSVINAQQKQIELEVLKKLATANRIFLVGDQDGAGQLCMTNISKLLPSEKVYRIEFVDSKDVGELALQWKKSEGFLGSFKENWEQLKTDALSSWVAHNIPFVSSISSKPIQWVIDRILPEGGLLLLSGKFGAHKSILALLMALGINLGTSVFGRAVPRKIPVLYIDRENPEQTIGERRLKFGVPDDVVRYWGDWLKDETPSLDDKNLEEFCIREKGVIIFDSLQDWLEGANENDPSQMTEVMRKFRRLARLGSGVIVLHHADKYRSGYRGTTAIPASTDMAVRVAKTEDGIVQLREERFRMCSTWELDLKFHFSDDQFTYEVVNDQNPERQKRQQAASAEELERARAEQRKAEDERLIEEARKVIESNAEAGKDPLSQNQLMKLAGIKSGHTRDRILCGGTEDDPRPWKIAAGKRGSVVFLPQEPNEASL